jgi:NAD-dependent SIR2 family protein deacetylase
VSTRGSTTAGLPRCIVCGEVIKLSVILAGEALRRFRGEAVEWRHERCAEVLIEDEAQRVVPAHELLRVRP